MSLQRLVLLFGFSVSSFLTHAQEGGTLADALRIPAQGVSEEARSEASAALLAAETNLYGGHVASAESAARAALKLDASRSLDAYKIACEAAWQASLLPPRLPADRQRALELLAAGLAMHSGDPGLLLLQARIKLHDGALDEAESLARSAFEKLARASGPSTLRLQRDCFNALLHARRGAWSSAAKLIIETDEWLPGYDFHFAAAEILERALKDGNTSPDVLRWTRGAYLGAHRFLSHRPRGPEIEANENRQLELLTQLGHWDLIGEFLRETLLPACPAPAHNARLLGLLEPVAKAGTAAFLLEKEAAKNKSSENLSALLAIDDLLAELQPRFAQVPRFLEIRYDWTYATAHALLRPDATEEQKTRAALSLNACHSLLGEDWRRHSQLLSLLNRATRHKEADTLAQRLFDNAAKLGVATTHDWSALGSAFEFAHSKAKLYETLAFACYERAVQLDRKTNSLNFAAVLGKLRLGELSSADPVQLLDIVNQLAAESPAEAAAREAEVFLVRKRLCQKLVDDGRPLDAVLAYTKLAELTPKNRFVYHVSAASNIVAYFEATAKAAHWNIAPLPDPKTSFNRPLAEGIFDNLLAKYVGDQACIDRLQQERDLINLALARGAALSKNTPDSAAAARALTAYIRDLRAASPAHQKNQFNEYEAYACGTRLKSIYDHNSYSQSQVEEARDLRAQIEQLGGPNVDFARRVHAWIESSRSRAQAAARDAAARQQEAETRAATTAYYQTRAAPEARWRWCLRCSGSGYRTVWEDAQDPYTGRYRRAQMNKTCDRCWGKGTLPY